MKHVASAPSPLRRSGAGWGWALGLALGVMTALIWHAPAAWMAPWVASASQGRVLLSEAQGSLWRGEAQVVLTGGAASQEATRLPSPLLWRWAWQGGPQLRVQLAGFTPGEVALALQPSWRRWALSLPAASEPVLHLPALWLKGLGTPWNTLLLRGDLAVLAPGVRLHWGGAQAPTLEGTLTLEARHIGSALSTLPSLGSYRLTLQAPDAAAPSALQIQLNTLEGALQIQGGGQWRAGRLSFQGEARASAGAETSLNNLLNIIGRRQGERSVITIGS